MPVCAVADSPLGTSLGSTSDAVSCFALGKGTRARAQLSLAVTAALPRIPTPQPRYPLQGPLECHHFLGKTSLPLASLSSLGCPPVTVPTPSPAGVYPAVAETKVPWRVAWFQHELLKVMACKGSLCGRCLHFCLSLGCFNCRQVGTEPRVRPRVCPLHQHSTQACEPEPSGFVQVLKNLLP